MIITLESLTTVRRATRAGWQKGESHPEIMTRAGDHRQGATFNHRDTPIPLDAISDYIDAFDGIETVNSLVRALFMALVLLAANFVFAAQGPGPGNPTITYSVAEGSSLSIVAPGVLTNIYSTDRNAQCSDASLPSHGFLFLNSNGSFYYEPNAGFNGQDSFTFTATDPSTGFSWGTQSVTINVDSVPVANNDTYTVNAGSTLSIATPGVLGNDTNADGNSLTAVLSTGPGHGKLTLNPDGSFSYTPNANFYGTDSFTYTAQNGVAVSNTATESITVYSVPVANNDSYTTNVDTTLSVSAPGVLSNDTNADNNPLTATLSTGPINGVLTLNPNGSFNYTPNAGFYGPDSFTYTAQHCTAVSNTATVTITVYADPVPGSYTYSVAAGSTLNVLAPGLLAKATDANGGTMQCNGTEYGPSDGSLTLNSNGSFSYTPNAGIYGQDFIAFWVEDSYGAWGMGSLTINVDSVPVAVDDSYSTDVNMTLSIAAPGVLGNDTNADSNPLTAVLGTAPSNGTVTLNANGSFTYIPDADYTGPDSFTYTAQNGAAFSNTATVSITVYSVPVANDDSYTTNIGTSLSVSAPGVLGNDTNADNNPLTAVLGTGPSHGTLTLNSNGSFNYVPDANFSGTDSFTYTAQNGTTVSNTATVTITVYSFPVANDNNYVTNVGTTIAIAAPGVLGNAVNADGNPLTAVLGTGPSNGTLKLNADGSFSYTPNAGFIGTDSFTYSAKNGTAFSPPATVTITVFALTSNWNGYQPLNTPLTLTATALGGGALYQFRSLYQSVTGAYVWSTIQNYSSSNVCTSWTPAMAGPFTVYVFAEDQSQTATARLMAVTVVTAIDSTLTGVTLTSNWPAARPLGTALTLTATPNDAPSPFLYQFRALHQQVDGTPIWSTIQDFSTNNVCTSWTPPAAGPYTIYVFAREQSSRVMYQVSAATMVTAIDNTLTGVTLSSNWPTAESLGTALTLTATQHGADGVPILYQFRTLYTAADGASVWTTIQDFSTSNVCTSWTPAMAGHFTVYVYAREASSSAKYQVVGATIITAVDAALTGVTVTSNWPKAEPLDTALTLTATPSGTGTGTILYEFRSLSPAANGSCMDHDPEFRYR